MRIRSYSISEKHSGALWALVPFTEVNFYCAPSTAHTSQGFQNRKNIRALQQRDFILLAAAHKGSPQGMGTYLKALWQKYNISHRKPMESLRIIQITKQEKRCLIWPRFRCRGSAETAPHKTLTFWNCSAPQVFLHVVKTSELQTTSFLFTCPSWAGRDFPSYTQRQNIDDRFLG